MPEPIEPVRRPALDNDVEGLDCFAAEGASFVDEADDAAAAASAPRAKWPWPRPTRDALLSTAAVLLAAIAIGMWIAAGRHPDPVRDASAVSSPAPPQPPVVAGTTSPREAAEPAAAGPAPARADGDRSSSAAALTASPRAADRPRRPPSPPTAGADAAPAAIEAAPAVPIDRVAVAAPPAVAVPLEEPVIPAAEEAIVTPPNDRVLIERVLEQYRDAYERLDAPSAAVIWPRVDTRALARAFSTLAGQDVTFDSCDVDIAGERARARCVGEIRYVRRVGDQTPRVRRLSWSFALERVSDRWQIAQVTAD